MEIRWIQCVVGHHKTPCKELLINLDPSSKRFIDKAAIQWMLISGQPNCSLRQVTVGDDCGFICMDQ